jgi:hypothetical protein
MFAATLALAALIPTAGAPIRLHPDNPRYFEFRGKPAVLITSGEHYGAVLNLDFDFVPYLDELKSKGLNLTRTFSGTYREVPGSFKIRDNTLAPKPGRFQSPWLRVSKDGEPEKFDLDCFDPSYFERLKAFLRAAGERGVVVELVLFCPLYEGVLWDSSPMNARNNVNDLGELPREKVLTLDNGPLLDRQLALVRKVVGELREFDNLYYEICNEPYFGGVTIEWQHRIADTIVDAEKEFEHKHLVAQNIANDKAVVKDPHPAVSILNFHYASPPDAVAMNWDLNKPIAFDETGFKGTSDRIYRQQAWEFLLAGGSVFSHLDYSFTPDHEDGTAKVEDPTPGGGGPSFRRQMSVLKRTIEALDFLHMTPDREVVRVDRDDGKPAQASVLARRGKAYLIYVPGGDRVSVSLDLPPGRYAAEWIDPKFGSTPARHELNVAGEGARVGLASPSFPEDFALRIVAREGSSRLVPSEDRRFLVHDDGTPFFYLGDTAWELFHRLNREEAELYLRDRAAKGFTVIQAVVLAELDGLHAPNAEGHTPLLDDDPAKPNEDYFRHVDWIVAKANELGLYIGMLPTWGDKVNKKWGQGPEVFTPENARAYGEFLGKRYKDRQIIWILGGDRPVENETHRAIWDAMAEGLKAGDGGTHLMTYHPMGGGSSAEPFHGASWLGFNMIQSGHSRKDSPNYEMIAWDYGREPVKPVLDGEPRYEDHPIDWRPQNGWFDAHDVRKAAYWSVFAGACGVTYGCHDIWQFWQPGRDPISSARTPWREALKLPGSAQVGFLRRLVESRPYLERIPDQALIVGDAGQGGDHVQATRGRDGSYALIYLPSGKPVAIDLEKLHWAEVVAWWFDPTTGQAKPGDRLSRGGRVTFTPPAGGRDWVLVLDDAARNFPPPGPPGVSASAG